MQQGKNFNNKKYVHLKKKALTVVMLLGVRSKSYFCVHVALAGATAVFLSFVKLL
jgi:hypothetical protein